MNHMKNYLYANKKSTIYLLVLALLMGSVIVAQAYLLVAVIDGVFLQERSFQEILPFLGGLLFILFARSFIPFISGKIGIRLGSEAKSHFRHRLVAHFSNNPVQASLKGQAGQKVSVMMDAIDEVDSYFSSYIPQVIRSSVIPVIILMVVFLEHVNSGLIMLITSPFIPLFMVIIGMQTKKKSEEQMEELAAFSGRFLDTLQGLVTLKLFGKAKQQKHAIQTSSLRFRDATMEILKVAFTSSFMLELISMLAIGLVALEVALQLIVFDGISFFTAFLVLILAPEYFTSLRELGTAFHNGKSSMGAAKKVEEELALDEVSAVTWGETPLSKKEEPVQLELQGATFQYGEDEFMLRPIHITFAPRTKNAIVGKTGSGKSTLLHLIAGIMLPDEGSILVDGKPLTSYQEADWFAQLGYISQHPYIFAGSIADNIAIGNKQGTTREAIERAAEQAGLADMVGELENGYDTYVGEGGRGLSGGEKQRLALARAFLKRPAIILFDEPTTGLDLRTERILQASIEKLAKAATIITVAHRLHTIKDADRILYLDQGRLVAEGTHEQLIQRVEGYRKMVMVQRGGQR
ncbi:MULTISPECIES: thiol reductant ABC exporter subunit CydD [Clostridia]|uniref:thiol reductant ABC exporter subunit CydD n=1 Tax=Clostridia TaxID=186801 RepID=UPI000EA3F6A5|nr:MULTISPECIES: thiol reductant ABC exporter subunit CydD [Clostridia]NBJ67949.1 thiol reductant ABC exporter subunit CydD [Roseburia sp. 1XD42-34]RKI82396.1 thiol reductant ABC exporter subunit CydD [Clostridium sp. 1xD42-85]